MLLRVIVTFWLVAPPPKSPTRMPRATPFWIRFPVTVRPLTPPPMTT
jgi:hypothetical protein